MGVIYTAILKIYLIAEVQLVPSHRAAKNVETDIEQETNSVMTETILTEMDAKVLDMIALLSSITNVTGEMRTIMIYVSLSPLLKSIK